jgi:hypothetical protein
VRKPRPEEPKLIDFGDVLAGSGYNPVGQLPAFELHERSSAKKSNRYLKFQQKRIYNCILNKRYDKAVIL